MKFSNYPALLIAALVSCVLSAPLTALESDRDQPVQIESDSARFDEQQGVTSYSGNVRLTQGSIELLADRIDLISENGEIVELVATGAPAHYEQLPEPDAQKLIARANSIRYQLSQDLIELVGQASLSQEGTTLSGGQILYDVRQHVLRASSSEGSETRDRVRVTLPPLGGREEQ